jgi:hypothetical protein
MKTRICILFALASLAAVAAVRAQVPEIITYSGRIASQGQSFTGTRDFKFALIDGDTGESLWSNDGTSVDGSEPDEPVEVAVNSGLFTVGLGDTSLGNMLPIEPPIFTHPDVRLRVWFRSGGNAFTQISPDTRLTSVGYAMMSARVLDGAITAEMLADGAVTGDKIEPNSITSDQISNTLTLQRLNLGSLNWDGSLHLFAKPTGGGGGIVNPAGAWRGFMAADALGSELNLFFSNGSTGAVLSARSPGGRMRFWDGAGRLAGLLGVTTGGGDLNLFQINEQPGIRLNGDRSTFDNQTSSGGEISVHTRGGHVGVLVDGDHSDAGRIEIRQPNAIQPHVDIFGRGQADGGEIRIKDRAGTTATVRLIGAQQSNTGGRLEMSQANGQLTVVLDAEGGNGGGFLTLRKSDGTQTIVLDSDQGGRGRVTTQVLEITGGSDLSEKFDIATPGVEVEPGMVVCIDPVNTGRLILSERAYDRTVAGIISGAGGVSPGMLMGQAGTAADGRYPVALAGRVYCRVDASYGAVAPGDLITTSTTPGHGMKVSDPAQAHGAILGKAMTSLDEGQGLVLVLVSLH